MISYKTDVLERLSLSEVKMGRGSPICGRVRKRLWNTLKTTFRNVKLLDALRRHCITYRHDSVIDITKWAQEYFQKPLLVNTICLTICWCQLKVYHAIRKPYVNMVQKHRHVLTAKTHLKWTVSKWKSIIWSEFDFEIWVQILLSYWKSWTPCPPG